MDCLFCKIIEKAIPSDIVFEDEQLVAFRDINPQAPTHVLIIPRKHIPTINELESDDSLLIAEMVLRAKQLAAELGVAEDGYRLVFNANKHGGQDIYHIHLHLLAGRQMHWPPG